MKKFKLLLLVLLIAFSAVKYHAQSGNRSPFIEKLRFSPWVVGHGWNVVHDDGGKWFKNLFKVNEVWNATPYPLRFSAEKWLYNKNDTSGSTRGWSVELSGAYNRYGVGNYLFDTKTPVLVPIPYKLFSFDLHAKYNFNKILDLNKILGAKEEIFQPYGIMGLGYTYRTLPAHPNTVNLDVGLGFNVWIYKNIGIQVQSVAKFGLKNRFPTSGSNYLQHSVGIVYQINLKPKTGGDGYMHDFIEEMKQTPWVVGHGWNIVQDDAGKWFKNLFNVDKAWNMAPYPVRFTCEKYLYSKKDSTSAKRGWSVEFMAAYNRYGIGNILKDKTPTPELVTKEYILLSFDLHAKYNFNKLVDLNKLMGAKKEIFQPFGTFGLGYTYRTLPAHPGCGTINAGLGFNVWIYKGIGIQVQSLAKFGLEDKFPHAGSNYLQHSISIVYKIERRTGNGGNRYKFKKHNIKKVL
jgi:hypothetical protein